MEALTKQVELFHNIFLVCLILFLVLLAIDIFLFFYLDIRKVFGFLSGKTAKKVIEQMQEDGLTSGTLGQDKKKKGKKSASSKPKKKRAIMTPSGEMMKPGTNEVMEAAGGEITDMLDGYESTNPTFLEGNETEVINQSSGNIYGRFDIVKSILFIHTEEQI